MKKNLVATISGIIITTIVLASVLTWYFVYYESTPNGPPGPTEPVYQEAPELADLVEAGELPPVKERLPKNPIIIQPVDHLGDYGGTWRKVLRGQWDHSHFLKVISYEYLVRWDPEWTKIIPNVAQSYDVNNDATEYIFHLREGLRWSDGEYFTADDIVFWYEDLVMNSELWEAPPDWFIINGQPGHVEKIDNYTVSVQFEESYGLFLENMIVPTSNAMTNFPKHYFKQFLPKYNPNIDELVEQYNVSDWVELIKEKVGKAGVMFHFRNPDLPTLDAWVVQNGYFEGTEKVVCKRNPYYWKIDADYKQLPYISEIEFTVVEDQEALLDLALAGEIDMQIRKISNPEYKELFEPIMEEMNYEFITTIPSTANRMLIHFNILHADPEMREILSNKDFRIGLSYAINRSAIIDTVWSGCGDSHQAAPLPSSIFHHEQLAAQYLEYDITLANEYLDLAGYATLDEDGYRLDSNGERINITVEIVDEYGHVEAMNLIKDYWHNVGINASIKIDDRVTLAESIENNEHDATVWTSTDGMFILINPGEYLPNAIGKTCAYAVPWAYWFGNSSHPLAEEPPESVKQQIALYTQIKSSGNQTERIDLMRQILDIAADYFWVMGISTWGSGFGVKKTYFHNVPMVMPEAWLYPQPAPTNPCQYYMEPHNETTMNFVAIRTTLRIFSSSNDFSNLNDFMTCAVIRRF
ncbi:MAG: ABC transporter substrate-binding protein [Candidatus Heimdallarchaeaceae archaeon]